MRDAELPLERGPTSGAELLAEELDDSLAEESESGGAVEPSVITEPPASRMPRPAGSHDLAAEIDPQYTSPSCGGINPVTLNVGGQASGGCYWERLDDTSGTPAQATCDDGYNVVSGGCYGASASHNLIRSYPTEGTFDVVGASANDSSTMFYSGTGWACEWDTAASGTSNKHIALALCCSTYGPAVCS